MKKRECNSLQNQLALCPTARKKVGGKVNMMTSYLLLMTFLTHGIQALQH